VIFLDIETSGLYPKTHGILSIGACTGDGQNFYGECRLRPEANVSKRALEINGFTMDEIDDPELQDEWELYAGFVDWCRERDDFLLCGENVGSFDVGFLMAAHKLAGDEDKWLFGYRYLDLHTLAYYKLGKSMSQDEVREWLNLGAEPQPHNALTGANCARETWFKLLEVE